MSRLVLSPFPNGTFLINIVGSFLIGIVYVLGIERAVIPPAWRVGLMVGFLGGFTTFSSYSLESARLLEEMEVWYAVLYFVLSPLLGVGAALAGIYLSRYLMRG